MAEAIPDPAALESLTLAGVSDVVARKLAATCDPTDVGGWCTCARDPAGLIVARLKAGEPPLQELPGIISEPVYDVSERVPRPESIEAERTWTAAQGELNGSLSPSTWESVIRPLEVVSQDYNSLMQHSLTGLAVPLLLLLPIYQIGGILRVKDQQ